MYPPYEKSHGFLPWPLVYDISLRGYMEQQLLSVKELCEYLNIGETKARELLRGHNGFAVKLVIVGMQ